MRLPFLVFLLGSFLSISAAASEARDWLLRMTESATKQSFSGTYIYERSGNFSTYHIWHLAQPPSSSTEHLLQLDGQGQEVLLVDGQVRCSTTDLQDHFVGVQGPTGKRLDVTRLVQSYEAQMLGTSRVAGRSAVVLLLLPRNADRYARELHLDSKTGLLLKSLLLNGQGQLLERLQYTSLSADLPITAEDLQPSAACIESASASSVPAVQSLWKIGWLPEGFVLSSTQEQAGASVGVPVESQMYDDGLARFSIFIESLEGVAMANAHAQLGPTVVVSRPVNTPSGQFMVTLVGEIPLATAEQVVLSVTGKDVAGVKR